MTTLVDKAILSGADNRPPMLEKDMYDSWKRIMELYMMNRQHGRMILESVENAIQADCDIKATNIILQGLPLEVYALVSNHKVAKELWARIQLLMQGTSLTKQERVFNQQPEFCQPDSGLIVPVFQKGNDPIDAINHMMSFLTAVGRQTSLAAGTTRTYTPGASGSNSRKQRTVIYALAEVHNHDNMNNNMINQDVQAMPSSEQSNVVNHSETEITSCSDILYSSAQQDALILSVIEQLKTQEISDLNASLQEKVLEITALKDDLRKLKRKALVDNAVTKHTIDPEMLKIYVEPITPILYAKLIQELLTHISKTCPSINNSGEQLVATTPKNKNKRVRFTEPITSSGNTITKTASTSNLVSNKPMLSSTGVKPSTSASGSQPLCNTKKDKNQKIPSSTQMNKHYKLNANSELKCVKCNGCMLSDNHDLCVLDFINNVNARNKSKFVKQSSKRKVLKLTGKVVQIVLWTVETQLTSRLVNFVMSNLDVVFVNNLLHFINLEGVDLFNWILIATNLYTLSLGDMMASSTICLFFFLSKAIKSKSLASYCTDGLFYLNFGCNHHLARQGLVEDHGERCNRSEMRDACLILRKSKGRRRLERHVDATCC
ncbi:hypothetical protein Tco_0587018 [Tanacetum coccineum]